ncbi:hypothetical protein [uncultured Marinobacter sp.]|uniref:hypothetical protein n=1 Tax=uncultured Marinobacter sp. TaxID=187379 RepID=UPI002622E110|nr:hypothetical protein [uncultured Marinobacter sp.]
MIIKTNVSISMPRLTWFAEYHLSHNRVFITHGKNVEVGKNCIVEGVWDGQYEDFKFEESNHFFGSALKILNDDLIIVPSTGLVDRIFIGKSSEAYYISNSLIEILARTSSKLDPDHNYKIQTNTIQNGFKNYTNEYPIISEKIESLQQYFYHPIKLNAKSTIIINRPKPVEFLSYEHYKSKIKNDLYNIYLNSSSPFRKNKIDLYTTVSKGYDSPAVTILTEDLPIKTAFTSKISNSSILGYLSKESINDDGTEIAEKLGLSVTYLDFRGIEVDEDELYFLAATTGGPELQFYKVHKILETSDNPSIVLTGYHGDTIWSLSPPKAALTDDILKPGASGLTLSEARLKSGFINIPVPMMHARSIVSINHISTSEVMSGWSVGGDYDRPIPRRIVESAGIGRNSFGKKKRAIATFYDLPRNKDLRKEFLIYMKKRHKYSATRILIGFLEDRLKYNLKMTLFSFDRSYLKMGKFKRPLDGHAIDTPYQMHVWSLEKLTKIRRNAFDSQTNNLAE